MIERSHGDYVIEWWTSSDYFILAFPGTTDSGTDVFICLILLMPHFDFICREFMASSSNAAHPRPVITTITPLPTLTPLPCWNWQWTESLSFSGFSLLPLKQRVLLSHAKMNSLFQVSMMFSRSFNLIIRKLILLQVPPFFLFTSGWFCDSFS